MNTTFRTRASVGAVVLFAVVASVTLLAGASPASAQTTNVHLMELVIGAIPVTWDGLESISDNHLTLTGAQADGGPIDVGNINILSMVDAYGSGEHLVLLLVQVTFSNLACTVTIHGPLLIDHVSGNDYHAFFDNVSAVGGLLFSGIGCIFLADIVTDLINDNGVLAHFEIF